MNDVFNGLKLQLLISSETLSCPCFARELLNTDGNETFSGYLTRSYNIISMFTLENTRAQVFDTFQLQDGSRLTVLFRP